MPLRPYLSRRRVLLALALLAAGLGTAGLIAAWGKDPPSRCMYTQLQVGMTPNEVEGLLAPGCPDGPESIGAGVGPREGSRNRHLPLEVWAMDDGARITVHYDGKDRVRAKEIDEGDQSVTARLKRLAGRLRRP